MSEQETTPNGQAPGETRPQAPVKEPKAKKPKAHKTTPFESGEQGILTKEQAKHVVLVTDENDPLWDPKMKLPVPKSLVDDMSDKAFGWGRGHPLQLLPDGRIKEGRTKWRAALKVGLDKVEVPYVVLDEGGDEIHAMRVGIRQNEHRQEIDPMTRAESVVRGLSAGLSEKEVADDHGITINDVHGYMEIIRLPETVQGLLKDGKMSFAAAVELVRKMESMSNAEVTKAAEDIAKAAAGGVKITAAKVKAQHGEDRVATLREKKQFILDLGQEGYFDGKMGEAVRWAMILGLEVGIGTRAVKSAQAVGQHLGKGKTPKVDFRQYQSAADAKEKTEK